MLFNYLKTAFRVLFKNPISSFINMFGLSVAIGCAVVVYVYIHFDLDVDQFHENKENIYFINLSIDRDGKEQLFGFSPRPLANRMREDLPQVKEITRIEYKKVVVKYQDQVLYETVKFVDPDYLDIFTFPLKLGSKDALNNKNQVILSEKTAEKYFGSENPMGKTISLDFGKGRKFEFVVGGVAEKFPNHISIDFSILSHFEVLKQGDPEFDLNNWEEFIDATVVVLDNKEDLAAVQANMDGYMAIQNGVNDEWPIRSFEFEALSDIRMRPQEIRSSLGDTSDQEGRIVLSIIGILLITLACLNYINIAIVSATRRLKEIGIRKVMGGSRFSIFLQFIGENILMTALATVFGLILAFTIFIPGFDDLFSIGVEVTVWDPKLWLYLLVLLFFTGLASGAYPAFYISKFQSINILRDRLKFGRKNRLTKAFLALQLMLSIMAVLSGILFTQNVKYTEARDWGYDQKQVLATPVQDYSAFTTLKQALAQHPDIERISGSRDHLGTRVEQAIIELPERKYEVYCMAVDTAYIPTVGLRLKEGRAFQSQFKADSNNVMVNETLVQRLEWEDPVGQTFRYQGEAYTVVGVLEDYHHYSFWSPIRPAFFRLAEKESFRYLTLQVSTENTAPAFKHLEAQWAALFPDIPFQGSYQEQYFEYYFRNIDGHGKLMTFIAFLAVVLALLGLYGLVSLNVAGRTKEFSIRKVLGADLMSLAKLINKQYLWVMILAILIGGPLSFAALSFMFDSIYEYHMPLTYVPVIYAVGLILLLVLLTTSTQVRKVMLNNPSDGLRDE